MAAKEALEEAFQTYNSLKEICDDVQKRILINPASSFARKLILPEKIKRKKKKEDIINDYFDSLNIENMYEVLMKILGEIQ